MILNKNRRFGENNQEEYFIFHGQIDRRGKLYPTLEEESEERSLPQIRWAYEWSRPKLSTGIEGNILPVFQTGKSVRNGRSIYIGGMKVLESPHIPNHMGLLKKEYSFVSGFGGFGDISDIINQIITGIRESALNIIKAREAPYQKSIQEVQIQQSKPIESKFTKYVPYILGGTILYFFIKKGGKK